MTKKTFFNFWLLLTILLVSGGAWAQQSLQWQDNIRSIVFQDNELIINFFNGTQSVQPLDNVRSLLFTQSGTSIGKPAETGNMRVLITADELRVESAEPVRALTVIDLNGRTLRRTNAESLNISTLAKGVYLLRIETATTASVRKFIKP